MRYSGGLDERTRLMQQPNPLQEGDWIWRFVWHSHVPCARKTYLPPIVYSRVRPKCSSLRCGWLLSTSALDLQTTATLITLLFMASPVPDNNPLSSLQDSSSTWNSRSKPVEGLVAWAAAHKNDSPHREKIERTPGDGRRNHGGPIRVTSKDGVLTEYVKKVEQERRQFPS